ncbi:MAG: hypothetical protein PWP37_1432 [Thermotogota bacterium]|nr:hypothetical protein [Thermotogota bacterium]MDK2865240.1 hypothetical protein [Thermotogota bacterium]
MKKCIIFDMDGVLVDSEKIYFQAISEVVESFGRRLDRELFKKTMGVPMEKGGARILMDVLNINGDEKEFLNRLKESYEKHFYRSLEPRPGILELLEFFKTKNLKICVATSTYRDMAMKRLKNAGLIGYMDYIVCGDEIEKPKPDPDIFLKALEHSGCTSDEALVLEDSPNGVKAAKNAGIEVYGILHDFNDPEELLELGALKVFCLPDDVEKIKRLVFQ